MGAGPWEGRPPREKGQSDLLGSTPALGETSSIFCDSPRGKGILVSVIHTGEKMGQEIGGKEKVKDALLLRPLMAPDPSTQHTKVMCGAPAASRRHSVSFVV